MPKERNTKKIVLISIISAVGALLIAAGVAFLAIPVDVTEQYYLELGSEINADVKEYTNGFRPGNLISRVDVSAVDTDTTGTYEAYVRQGFYKHKFEFVVQDTIAPELVLKKGNVVMQADTKYSADYFVTDVVDISNDVTIYLADKPAFGEEAYGETLAFDEEISYEKAGHFDVELLAVDASGNEKTYTKSVLVKYPPEIVAKDYYVVPGAEIDFADVEIKDSWNNQLHDSLEIDSEGVDLSTIGTYELSYSCVDDFGFIGSASCTVNVMEAMDIQDLINTHKIHHSTDIIVGAYNKYDNGYYENMSIDEVMEEMRKTLVHIWGGDDTGSGFIIEITDEEVIIATNEHVVDGDTEVTVHFEKEMSVGIRGKVVYANYDNDIAFVSVPLSDVKRPGQNGLYDYIATVHINMGYWNSIKKGDDINVGITNVDWNGEIIHHETGKLGFKSSTMSSYYRPWRNLKKMLYVTADSYPGMSGSVIYDQNGNCLGVVWGKYEATGNDAYGIPLDKLCELYESHFGRKPYYH